MNTEIVTALIGILATGLSSVLTYVLTKRKYNAEVDRQVIDNLQHSLDFYIKLSEDTSNRLDEYHKDNMELRKENEELRQKITELQTQVSYLKRNICFKESCKEREDMESNTAKTNRRNGAKGTEKVEKK